jgi:hypothetical protein
VNRRGKPTPFGLDVTEAKVFAGIEGSAVGTASEHDIISLTIAARRSALEAKEMAPDRVGAGDLATAGRGARLCETELVALEVSDNVAVGRLDPRELPSVAHTLDLSPKGA